MRKVVFFLMVGLLAGTASAQSMDSAQFMDWYRAGVGDRHSGGQQL